MKVEEIIIGGGDGESAKRGQEGRNGERVITTKYK